MALRARPRLRCGLRPGHFDFSDNRVPGLKLCFPERRTEPKNGAASSGTSKRWTENRFDRLDLSGHSRHYDHPKSLYLRRRLLYGFGRYPVGQRLREPILQEIDGAFNDFLNPKESRLPNVGNSKRRGNHAPALASVSADVFKQPITIVGAVIVLLLLD